MEIDIKSNNRCFIWGTEASSVYAVNDAMWYVNSPRSGGRYGISADLFDSVDNLSCWEKARLTTWLIKQRYKAEILPVITRSTIDSTIVTSPLDEDLGIVYLLDYLSKIVLSDKLLANWMGVEGRLHRMKMMAYTESVLFIELAMKLDRLKKKKFIDESLSLRDEGYQYLEDYDGIMLSSSVGTN